MEGLLGPYKDTIIKLVVKQVIEHLVKKAAWISLAPVNWILVQILTKIFSIALEKTILGINMVAIEIEYRGEVKTFKKILEEAKNTPKEDVEKSHEIEERLIESGRELIRLFDTKRL